MTERIVVAPPVGEDWHWIEEFGGGEWVYIPKRRTLETHQQVLQAVLYGPAYQGPTSTRQSVGLWSQFRGPGT